MPVKCFVWPGRGLFLPAGDNTLPVPVPVPVPVCPAAVPCLFLLTPGDFPDGNRAVMLRTEPAALSLPGPFGAAGFHPNVATSTAGLLRPFRSRRPLRAVACAFRTPAN
ncbi:hypothetical protein J6211_004120 [Salmonella enterica]|nr:hypothetical protein [Salmonella enterica]